MLFWTLYFEQQEPHLLQVGHVDVSGLMLPALTVS